MFVLEVYVFLTLSWPRWSFQVEDLELLTKKQEAHLFLCSHSQYALLPRHFM